MDNQIQQWLNGPMDYEAGKALFEKYSNKTPLINLLRRKYKPEVLRYNLAKINRQHSKIKPDSKPQQDKKGVVQKSIPPDKITPEELPDHLRKLYEQNKELYKHMRSYHEKMKAAQTDEERGKYRKIVAEYDDQIAGNWNQIDRWDGSRQEDNEPEPDAEKAIAAARKYLSVNVKHIALREGIKQQQLIFSIQEKVSLLQKHGVQIPKSTITELRKFGINY